jgi:type IV pilus assembly protein PilA
VHLIHSLKSRRDAEEGFTLIELMVVVLIIAILIAIAIPTFLGARQRAQDRAAQSDLRNGLTAEKTFYTDGESYADSSAAGSTALKGIEPSLSWGTKLTWNSGDVVVAGVTTANAAVCLQQDSKSGKTFAIADVAMGPNAGTYYNTAACPGTVTGAAFAGWKTNGW